MAEFQGGRIAEPKDSRCWRLCHVQTSGGMAVERRTDEQKEQQQIVLDNVTDGGCDAVGLGDTRLGDDASEVSRMARGVMVRVHDEALAAKLHGLDAQRRAEARAQHGKARDWRELALGGVPQRRKRYLVWRGGCRLVRRGGATRELGYQRCERLGVDTVGVCTRVRGGKSWLWL